MSDKKKAAASEVADVKNLFDVELDDEAHRKLQSISRDILRVEIANERAALKRLHPVYKKRRETVKSIPKFWPVALMNNPLFAQLCQHADDQKAISALQDLWVERDPVEDRCFTLEFHFGENPYFSDKVLRKEYRYVPPNGAKDETPDENGVTDSMTDFDWDRDAVAQKTKISWKSDAVNLTKLYPRVVEKDEIVDHGSFFNFFEEKDDPEELGVTIATQIFPEAVDFFTGKFESYLTDEEDSEEEDEDEEDEEEIDLEQPEPKKRKKQ